MVHGGDRLTWCGVVHDVERLAAASVFSVQLQLQLQRSALASASVFSVQRQRAPCGSISFSMFQLQHSASVAWLLQLQREASASASVFSVQRSARALLQLQLYCQRQKLQRRCASVAAVVSSDSVTSAC